MIASLPMYLRPENCAAHDAFWALVRDHLRDAGHDAPDALDHDIDHIASWQRPDLTLGMICNLPYRARFRGQVTLVGAADYGVDGEAAGYYHSVFLVRRDDRARRAQDARDHRFAYNDALSQSGYGAPQLWAQSRGFAFRPHLETGAHIASARAVLAGDGDLAALDAVTWRQLQRWEPDMAGLRVIGHTDPSPALTFITARGNDPAPLRAAIAGAIAALAQPDRDILGLCSIVSLPETAYDLPLPPTPTDVFAFT